MYNVKIISTGKYIPNNIVTNDDISKFVDTNDKWISERTGIKERRISTGENTSDMAIKAAIAALEKSSIKASDLDLIIVATCTPDSFVPSTACIVQDKLGASKATCFDVSAACTGFIYALGVAS
ncbi:3-oxoacyl-ACP synthase, partial [Clostridium botulinum C/D]|nr:3-oxoacyl-ACP synthase [Clostridium botulinum C/D]